jgi:hypothetical protein
MLVDLVQRSHASTGSNGGGTGLGLLLGLGIPLFVLTILGVVFTLAARSIARRTAEERAQLGHEGIVLDGGAVWLTIRYRGFRSDYLSIGVGIRKSRAVVVLTRERLALLPTSRHYFSIPRADLGRFTVGVADDGALRLATDEPPNASGHIEYQLAVDEAPAWIAALREAGARAA